MQDGMVVTVSLVWKGVNMPITFPYVALHTLGQENHNHFTIFRPYLFGKFFHTVTWIAVSPYSSLYQTKSIGTRSKHYFRESVPDHILSRNNDYFFQDTFESTSPYHTLTITAGTVLLFAPIHRPSINPTPGMHTNSNEITPLVHQISHHLANPVVANTRRFSPIGIFFVSMASFMMKHPDYPYIQNAVQAAK